MRIKAPLILLVFLLLTNPMFAQSSEPSSSVGVYLETLTHDKKGNMWVGGSVWLLQGLLLRINSAGVTVITPPNIATIQDIHFTSFQNALMIADYRNMYKSSDGGNTWRKVFSSAESNLNEITFIEVQLGWAVGNDGVIYHTEDGGETWQKQNSDIDVDLKQVVFVDNLHGWVTGWSILDLATQTYPSALLATNDGGKTWHQLADEKTLSLRNISFVNQLEGWAIDFKGNAVIHTLDGGKSWQAQSVLEKNHWGYVYFLDENHGWVIGKAMAFTQDGGKSWKYQKVPAIPSHRVAFRNPKIGGAISWSMSANAKGLDIIRTFDSGKSWQTVSKSWLKKTTGKVYREKFGNLGQNQNERQ